MFSAHQEASDLAHNLVGEGSEGGCHNSRDWMGAVIVDCDISCVDVEMNVVVVIAKYFFVNRRKDGFQKWVMPQ